MSRLSLFEYLLVSLPVSSPACDSPTDSTSPIFCYVCEMFSYSLASFSETHTCRKGSLFIALEARLSKFDGRFCTWDDPGYWLCSMIHEANLKKYVWTGLLWMLWCVKPDDQPNDWNYKLRAWSRGTLPQIWLDTDWIKFITLHYMSPLALQGA